MYVRGDFLNAAWVNDYPEGMRRPAGVDVLLTSVNQAFERTSANTPAWPDPHPERSPLDEEYSRVLNQGKYRILGSRVDAWVEALVNGGIAEARDVPAELWIGAVRPPDQQARVRRIEPTVPDGLCLLFATTLVDGLPFGLDLGIGRIGVRAVLLTRVPVCGCDACDSGSADLLQELDGWVLTVASGGVLHARSGEDVATRTTDGWSTSNAGDRDWLDQSTREPDGVERWVGASWL